MSRDMTNSEAIANLNHIYGMVSPDIQRSLDLAINALKDMEGLKEENHQNFVNSQHIISLLVEENKELRGKEGDLANEVWELYEKYHPRLATNVIEFGDELKDLLGKYQKGDSE